MSYPLRSPMHNICIMYIIQYITLSRDINTGFRIHIGFHSQEFNVEFLCTIVPKYVLCAMPEQTQIKADFKFMKILNLNIRLS